MTLVEDRICNGLGAGLASQNHEIIVTDIDLARLRSLADDTHLATELEAAVVVDSHAVSPDVVTMNSRVRFEDLHTGEIRDVTIVFPHEAKISDGKVSVLAPVGTALLGLSVGQCIRWPFPDGVMHSLRVLELIYQPEAEGQLAASNRLE